MKQKSEYRRQRAFISQFNTTQIHLKNPYVVAFFSFSFPGFGSLILDRYLIAFILIGWEIFINTQANINIGIMYSLLGEFDKAKDVLDERWLMLYVAMYMFGIWDSYRSTVDLNKQYLLADREGAPLRPMKMASWDINYLDKRVPWVALVWSVLAPGLGHLYVHKVITGFFTFGFTIAIMYFAHLPQVINLTMTGDFISALNVINMQWTLYLPSIYAFIFYDAYVSAIEYNKLFEKELSKYLRKKYQSPKFDLPV